MSRDPTPHKVPSSVDPLCQVNEVCNRFEKAWQAGQRPKIEDYLDGLGADVRSLAFEELVLLEMEYRRLQGESSEPHQAESQPARGVGIRRRTMIGLAGSVVAVGAGVGVWAWLRSDDDEQQTPTRRLAHLPLDDAKAYQRTWADYLNVPVKTTNALGMEMAFIPPGKFLVGSGREEMEAVLDQETDPKRRSLIRSEKQRPATIVKPFYLSTTPVTVGQFRTFVEETHYTTVAEQPGEDGELGWGWRTSPHFSGTELHRSREFSWKSIGLVELRDDFPVGNVGWLDVQRFLEWLNRKQPGSRLPTQAEWEYACRAGSTTRWFFGDDEKMLDLFAWYQPNSGNVIHPVRKKKPSAFGLYDMHGNCAEWCALPEKPTASDMAPPGFVEGQGRGTLRPVRGGRFNNAAQDVRSASRDWSRKEDYPGGFRILQEIDQEG